GLKTSLRLAVPVLRNGFPRDDQGSASRQASNGPSRGGGARPGRAFLEGLSPAGVSEPGGQTAHSRQQPRNAALGLPQPPCLLVELRRPGSPSRETEESCFESHARSVMEPPPVRHPLDTAEIGRAHV